MDEKIEHVAVSRVVVLQQVSVLVLGDDAAAPALPVALADAIAGPTRVLVIDCLAIRHLGPVLREVLVSAHRGLVRDKRHLIVVNAPAAEVSLLREHGVDVAATSDQEFGESSSGYAHGQQLI